MACGCGLRSRARRSRTAGADGKGFANFGLCIDFGVQINLTFQLIFILKKCEDSTTFHSGPVLHVSVSACRDQCEKERPEQSVRPRRGFGVAGRLAEKGEWTCMPGNQMSVFILSCKGSAKHLHQPVTRPYHFSSQLCDCKCWTEN